jgi:hypothetical protein
MVFFGERLSPPSMALFLGLLHMPFGECFGRLSFACIGKMYNNGA